MKEYSRKLLDKALDVIEAAELLVDMGKPDIGAGRAYYAMFYVAEAVWKAQCGACCVWRAFRENKINEEGI